MAEVVVRFASSIDSPRGGAFHAQVCGREIENGAWEGWIEFEAVDGSAVLPTQRETTQPNRTDLEHWADGLTAVFLEGALERAQHPRTPDLRPRSIDAPVHFNAPAPSRVAGGAAGGTTATKPRIRQRALLDPFQVYIRGEDLLRKELRALDEGHLRTIARAFDLADEAQLDGAGQNRAVLVELIVAEVRSRAG